MEPEEILRKSLEHIDKKRAALKLAPWEPARHGKSGDWRMEQLFSLPLEERIEALYGAPVTA